MSKEKLQELKENLRLAKEANDLTVSNIGKIVNEASTNIINELKFNKDMSSDALKDVLDTTTTSLEELGELTSQNIKASSDGVKRALKDELNNKSKKIEDVYHILTDDAKKDISEKVDTFKTLSELSLDVLQHAVDGAIKGAKDALEDKK